MREPSTKELYLWALSFLMPYSGPILLLIGCDLSVSLLQMAAPKVIQHLIDTVLPRKNSQILLLSLIILVLMFFLTYCFTAARNLLSRTISEKPSRDVQMLLLRKLHDGGFAYYERKTVGETLSVLHSDVGALQGFYRDSPKLIQDLLLVGAMTGIMVVTHWKLSLSVLPCFALFYLAEPYLSKMSDVWSKQRAESLHRRNRQMYISLAALAEVRAHGAEEWDIDNLEASVEAYHDADLKSAFYRLLRAAIRNLSITSGAVVLFVYGSYLVRMHALTVGELVSLSMIYFIAIGRFTFLFFRVSALRTLQHQIKPLFRLSRLTPEIREAAEPVKLSSIQGELVFSSVRFAYHGHPDVLKGFHLSIRAGERVVLVGPSGCGKTTLLKLVSRFYDPDEGEILLDGVPITRLQLSQLREAVGHVFQETFLFAAPIIDNIRFGKPQATDDEVMEAAKAAFAHDFITQLPNGYGTDVGERGVKLSGGQKQRIAIARMLLKNPAVVILDEATSALDQTAEADVIKSLDVALAGRTTLTVTHRLSSVRGFDRIVVMDEGKIVEAGTFEELIDKKSMFYRFYREQGPKGERHEMDI